MKNLFRILLVLIFIIVVTLGISYLISGTSTTIVSKVTISAPQELVFDYISDMQNELKWNPDVQFMHKESDGPVGMGTRFRAKWHLSDTLYVDITHFARPNNVSFHNGGPLEVDLKLVLTPMGSETKMESRFVVTPHGFLRAIFPILKGKLNSQESENMENLKRTLENNLR